MLYMIEQKIANLELSKESLQIFVRIGNKIINQLTMKTIQKILY